MRKVLFALVALLGSFLLGTNFRLEVNFGLDEESMLWTWVRIVQRIQRRVRGYRTPQVRAPRPSVSAPPPVAPVAPKPFGVRPSALGTRAFPPATTSGLPSKPALVNGSSWDSVKGRWLPPGLKPSPTGGFVWPSGKTETDWDYTNGAWKTNPFGPQPNGGLPKREQKPVGFGPGFRHPNVDEDEDEDEGYDEE